MTDSYVVFYAYDCDHHVIVSHKFFSSLHEARDWIKEHPDFWDFDIYMGVDPA